MNRYSLREIEAPPPETVPESFEAFLKELAGPTLIRVRGRDGSRCRAINTLLHGNEPSGAKAVHRFLLERREPATDLLIFVVSVATALTEPAFSHRHLPDERDMNRCFDPPYDDPQGELARQILAHLEQASPEATVDIHNTSGSGPAFCVCARDESLHGPVAALFTHRLIITELRLGAILEKTRPERPILTVECGGVGDGMADEVAWLGLQRFVGAHDIMSEDASHLDLYLHPVRLEVVPGTAIAYADEPQDYADITLPRHIDRRNFGIVEPDTPLAWLNDPHCVRVRAAHGNLPVDNYFAIRDGRLHPAVALKLFMVTTNPVIAAGDCLFYAVKERYHDRPGPGRSHSV